MPPGGWLDLAWLLLWLLGLAAILVVAPWEAIAFHLIWVSFGLMIWHARRRQAADAASARVSAANSRLLAAQVRFLQDASHQLRTPITIALGHAELLARTVADRAGQRDIHVVVGELNRLRRLSERLLVIAASENPDFLRPEPVAVDQLAAELLGCWRPAAARNWQLGPLDRATVAADRERLRLALDALLENAVQHTGPGDVIRLSAVRGPDSPAVSLVVQDSGPASRRARSRTSSSGSRRARRRATTPGPASGWPSSRPSRAGTAGRSASTARPVTAAGSSSACPRTRPARRPRRAIRATAGGRSERLGPRRPAVAQDPALGVPGRPRPARGRRGGRARARPQPVRARGRPDAACCRR